MRKDILNEIDPFSREALERGGFGRFNKTRQKTSKTKTSVPPIDEISSPKPKEILWKSETDENTCGALVIIEFAANPPIRSMSHFVVIKDEEKSVFGFPYGGMETGSGECGIVDDDILATAMRETAEEAFGNREDVLKILKIKMAFEKPFDKIQVSYNHTVYPFHKILPSYLRFLLQKGEEQKALFLATAEEINDYVEQGIFLPTHTHAWIKFISKSDR